MPRPGPRPYECVRRAWHSDRQQPIRGSLIQEIFRLANEVHCSTTRKNREWQEKLPNVVLKAEEIIYSKANSKDEYLDVNTLWDRVNDAINTIIRRDESTETGELLQPCIEAALHLGCTPRRSSRSQRNESPRYYLRPETLEATSVPTYISNSKVNGTHTTNSPFMIHCPPYLTPDIVNFLHPCSDAGNHSVQRRNYGDVKKISVFSKKLAPSDAHHAPLPTPALSNTWSVYPLSYNNENLSDDPEFSSRPSNSYVHLMESNELGRCQSFSPVKLDASDVISSSKHEGTSNRGQEIECDLTLRLGSLVVPCSGAHLHMENSNASS